MWAALELGDRPVPGEEARTQHYEDKTGATQTTSDCEARSRLFCTLVLVGWSRAMPQFRRVILGPDHTLGQLRPAIAEAVRTLPGHGQTPRRTDAARPGLPARSTWPPADKRGRAAVRGPPDKDLLRASRAVNLREGQPLLRSSTRT